MYADYITLVATPNEKLEKFASAVRHNVSFRLNINEAKTNAITLNKLCLVRIDLVPNFKYIQRHNIRRH